MLGHVKQYTWSGASAYPVTFQTVANDFLTLTVTQNASFEFYEDTNAWVFWLYKFK